MNLHGTLLGVGGSATALAAIGFVARGAWRMGRRVVHIADAVQELTPNGGSSMKDTVTRTDTRLAELTERFDQHLDDHARAGGIK